MAVVPVFEASAFGASVFAASLVEGLVAAAVTFGWSPLVTTAWTPLSALGASVFGASTFTVGTVGAAIVVVGPDVRVLAGGTALVEGPVAGVVACGGSCFVITIAGSTFGGSIFGGSTFGASVMIGAVT